jgi:hypothetical protein
MSYAQIRSAVIGAVLAVSLITLSESGAQQPGNGPALNPRHPDIAETFLQDPWYWPEIWQINPQVQNPHLIFPGDILSLSYLDDGSPVIQLTRGADSASGPFEAGPTQRLSPQIRAESLEDAIPSIPYDTLRAFLSRPAILDPDTLDELPYVFAHPEGLLGSAGRDVYVRGTSAEPGMVFNVVHTGDALIDPDDGTIIGYQGLYVGQGRVRRAGDPATLYLTDTAREASIGDYLIEEEGIAPINFFPSAPANLVDGRIISVLDGVSMIGQYQVIVLNRGARDGLQPGHVLSVFQTGELVRDTTKTSGFSSNLVRLPDEPAGTTMVFRVFDRMSYALVMEATREIRVLDTVRNPES